jgi:Fe-S cluster biogenesis protein NfuA
MAKEAVIRRERVEQVLERIRPALRLNGADVELMGIEGNNARVALKGRCVESLSYLMGLQMGMERAMREEIPGFGHLIAQVA